jgi:hypothetical protein
LLASIDFQKEKALSPFWSAFAFDDHDLVQVCEVFFELFLRFSFLSSSAEAFAFGHESHISSFLCSSHINFMFKLFMEYAQLQVSLRVLRHAF